MCFLQDLESFMSQHTNENRALIEELKQDLIVNSVMEEQVKQQSTEYTQRLETLEVQVRKWIEREGVWVHERERSLLLYTVHFFEFRTLLEHMGKPSSAFIES